MALCLCQRQAVVEVEEVEEEAVAVEEVEEVEEVVAEVVAGATQRESQHLHPVKR